MYVFVTTATGAVTDASAAGGRLLATGGVTQIEGAAGGGLTPWSLIAGYGTRDEIGASAFYTHIDSGHFRLQSAGLAVGLYDRFELSYAHQWFDLGDTVPGETLELDVLGVKARLFGDAVFDQDRWWPQVSAGIQFKHNPTYDLVPRLLGATDRNGVDFYLSATKVFLAGLCGRNVLVNATVRRTEANQLGLLGFGGDRDDGPSLQFEGAAGVFLTDSLLFGGEYRGKPDQLRAFEENDFGDLFVAWLPYKGVSVTAAYAWLGNVANRPGEDAWYLSAQLSF